ncbi:unnamed protein product [Amoebophrya sp. A120]|nr:unnamed protein product [Amoebophrya sp. A120]|eukprot:GSA120T00019456001.1
MLTGTLYFLTAASLYASLYYFKTSPFISFVSVFVLAWCKLAVAKLDFSASRGWHLWFDVCIFCESCCHCCAVFLERCDYSAQNPEFRFVMRHLCTGVQLFTLFSWTVVVVVLAQPAGEEDEDFYVEETEEGSPNFVEIHHLAPGQRKELDKIPETSEVDLNAGPPEERRELLVLPGRHEEQNSTCSRLVVPSGSSLLVPATARRGSAKIVVPARRRKKSRESLFSKARNSFTLLRSSETSEPDSGYGGPTFGAHSFGLHVNFNEGYLQERHELNLNPLQEQQQRSWDGNNQDAGVTVSASSAGARGDKNRKAHTSTSAPPAEADRSASSQTGFPLQMTDINDEKATASSVHARTRTMVSTSCAPQVRAKEHHPLLFERVKRRAHLPTRFRSVAYMDALAWRRADLALGVGPPPANFFYHQMAPPTPGNYSVVRGEEEHRDINRGATSSTTRGDISKYNNKKAPIPGVDNAQLLEAGVGLRGGVPARMDEKFALSSTAGNKIGVTATSSSHRPNAGDSSDAGRRNDQTLASAVFDTVVKATASLGSAAFALFQRMRANRGGAGVLIQGDPQHAGGSDLENLSQDRPAPGLGTSSTAVVGRSTGSVGTSGTMISTKEVDNYTKTTLPNQEIPFEARSNTPAVQYLHAPCAIPVAPVVGSEADRAVSHLIHLAHEKQHGRFFESADAKELLAGALVVQEEAEIFGSSSNYKTTPDDELRKQPTASSSLQNHLNTTPTCFPDLSSVFRSAGTSSSSRGPTRAAGDEEEHLRRDQHLFNRGAERTGNDNSNSSGRETEIEASASAVLAETTTSKTRPHDHAAAGKKFAEAAEATEALVVSPDRREKSLLGNYNQNAADGRETALRGRDSFYLRDTHQEQFRHTGEVLLVFAPHTAREIIAAASTFETSWSSGHEANRLLEPCFVRNRIASAADYYTSWVFVLQEVSYWLKFVEKYDPEQEHLDLWHGRLGRMYAQFQNAVEEVCARIVSVVDDQSEDASGTTPTTTQLAVKPFQVPEKRFVEVNGFDAYSGLWFQTYCGVDGDAYFAGDYGTDSAQAHASSENASFVITEDDVEATLRLLENGLQHVESCLSRMMISASAVLDEGGNSSTLVAEVVAEKGTTTTTKEATCTSRGRAGEEMLNTDIDVLNYKTAASTGREGVLGSRSEQRLLLQKSESRSSTNRDNESNHLLEQITEASGSNTGGSTRDRTGGSSSSCTTYGAGGNYYGGSYHSLQFPVSVVSPPPRRSQERGGRRSFSRRSRREVDEEDNQVIRMNADSSENSSNSNLYSEILLMHNSSDEERAALGVDTGLEKSKCLIVDHAENQKGKNIAGDRDDESISNTRKTPIKKERVDSVPSKGGTTSKRTRNRKNRRINTPGGFRSTSSDGGNINQQDEIVITEDEGETNSTPAGGAKTSPKLPRDETSCSPAGSKMARDHQRAQLLNNNTFDMTIQISDFDPFSNSCRRRLSSEDGVMSAQSEDLHARTGPNSPSSSSEADHQDSSRLGMSKSHPLLFGEDLHLAAPSQGREPSTPPIARSGEETEFPLRRGSTTVQPALLSSQTSAEDELRSGGSPENKSINIVYAADEEYDENYLKDAKFDSRLTVLPFASPPATLFTDDDRSSSHSSHEKPGASGTSTSRRSSVAGVANVVSRRRQIASCEAEESGRAESVIIGEAASSSSQNTMNIRPVVPEKNATLEEPSNVTGTENCDEIKAEANSYEDGPLERQIEDVDDRECKVLAGTAVQKKYLQVPGIEVSAAGYGKNKKAKPKALPPVGEDGSSTGKGKEKIKFGRTCQLLGSAPAGNSREVGKTDQTAARGEDEIHGTTTHQKENIKSNAAIASKPPERQRLHYKLRKVPCSAPDFGKEIDIVCNGLGTTYDDGAAWQAAALPLRIFNGVSFLLLLAYIVLTIQSLLRAYFCDDDQKLIALRNERSADKILEQVSNFRVEDFYEVKLLHEEDECDASQELQHQRYSDGTSTGSFLFSSDVQDASRSRSASSQEQQLHNMKKPATKAEKYVIELLKRIDQSGSNVVYFTNAPVSPHSPRFGEHEEHRSKSKSKSGRFFMQRRKSLSNLFGAPGISSSSTLMKTTYQDQNPSASVPGGVLSPFENSTPQSTPDTTPFSSPALGRFGGMGGRDHSAGATGAEGPKEAPNLQYRQVLRNLHLRNTNSVGEDLSEPRPPRQEAIYAAQQATLPPLPVVQPQNSNYHKPSLRFFAEGLHSGVFRHVACRAECGRMVLATAFSVYFPEESDIDAVSRQTNLQKHKSCEFFGKEIVSISLEKTSCDVLVLFANGSIARCRSNTAGDDHATGRSTSSFSSKTTKVEFAGGGLRRAEKRAEALLPFPGHLYSHGGRAAGDGQVGAGSSWSTRPYDHDMLMAVKTKQNNEGLLLWLSQHQTKPKVRPPAGAAAPHGPPSSAKNVRTAQGQEQDLQTAAAAPASDHPNSSTSSSTASNLSRRRDVLLPHELLRRRDGNSTEEVEQEQLLQQVSAARRRSSPQEEILNSPNDDPPGKVYYKPKSRFLSLPLTFEETKLPLREIKFGIFAGQDRMLWHDKSRRTYVFGRERNEVEEDVGSASSAVRTFQQTDFKLLTTIHHPEWRSACSLSEDRFLLLRVGALEVMRRN